MRRCCGSYLGFYAVVNARRGEISWRAIRYLYACVFATWLVGPAALIALPPAATVMVMVIHVLEPIFGYRIPRAFSDSSVYFSIEVIVFVLMAGVLAGVCTRSWFTAGKALCAARVTNEMISLDPDGWPNGFKTPLRRVILWSLVALGWTALWIGISLWQWDPN